MIALLLLLAVAGAAVAMSGGSSEAGAQNSDNSKSETVLKNVLGDAPSIARPARGTSYPTNADFTVFRDTSPTGAPWIIWRGRHETMFGGMGLDADGQWWCVGFSFMRCTPKTGADFMDVVTDIVTHYVAPAIATALAVVIPGVGGIAAAGLVTLWTRLAQGASINQALIDQARDSMPSLLANTTFSRALDLVRKNVPSSALSAAKDALLTPDQRTAFDVGIAFGHAEKTQAEIVTLLKRAMPDRAGLIDQAISSGAAVTDVANSLGGSKALELVQGMLS